MPYGLSRNAAQLCATFGRAAGGPSALLFRMRSPRLSGKPLDDQVMSQAARSILVLFLVSGCGQLESPTDPRSVACASPAPYIEHANHVPGRYIVDLRDGVDVRAETQRLAMKYRFIVIDVFDAVLGGFVAELNDRAIAGLRCEDSVLSVSQVPTGGPP